MSYKRTLVFFAIFAALATFFYFYEIKGGEERRLAEEQEKRLFSFETEQVAKLTLATADKSIVVERQDGDWRITAPVNAPADVGAVDRLVDALAGITFERDIGVQSDLEPFGLGEPELQVEVVGERGILGTLMLGAETPDGSKRYVKASDKDSVFAANRSIKDSLDKSLFDLRDKTVLDFSADDVTAMAIVHEGVPFAFQKSEEGEWAIAGPEKYRADTDKIGRLLDSVANARAKKFVEEEATDLGKYDLVSPPTRLELNLASESTTLYFGDRIDPDGVFARRDGAGQVLELAASILDNFSADINDWRDKTVLHFERDDVAKLQVASGTQRTTVERSAGEAGAWRVTEPEPAKADEDEIEDMLTYLQGMKVVRFIRSEDSGDAARAIETPLAHATLWTDKGETPLSLILGEKEGDDLYAMTDPGGEFSIVNAGLMEQLIPSPDNLPERFKDKSVIEFTAADVEGIEISTGEASCSLDRDGVKWDLPDELDLQGYEIDRLLWNLQELDYATVVPKDHDDAYYGFDTPTLTIRLRGPVIDGELILTVGRRVPERESYYARGGDEGLVMEIDSGFVAEWVERFEQTTTD